MRSATPRARLCCNAFTFDKTTNCGMTDEIYDTKLQKSKNQLTSVSRSSLAYLKKKSILMHFDEKLSKQLLCLITKHS